MCASGKEGASEWPWGHEGAGNGSCSRSQAPCVGGCCWDKAGLTVRVTLLRVRGLPGAVVTEHMVNSCPPLPGTVFAGPPSHREAWQEQPSHGEGRQASCGLEP